MTSPRVAVVITCHNLGRTLQEALDSVLAQTVRPCEIVVVDDGSDDIFTRQTLDRVGRSGNRVVRTDNRGVSAARNAGIALTSADYIVLLDADDCLEPEYVETLAGHLDQHPELDFVSCGMRSFGDASGVWVPPQPDLINSLAFGAAHVSSVFRRRLWDGVGGFDEELEAYEDLDFWTTALELGFCGVVLPAPLFQYRIRPGSRLHRAWRRGTHPRVMRRLYEKHRELVTRRWEELLLAKEAFILEQRAHHEHLAYQRHRLQLELRDVQERIDETLGKLGQLGHSRAELGDLRRTVPISPVWGIDRGRPIDRYYIESFLAAHRHDIHGRVLEVKDAGYTRLFGDDRVAHSDVVDIDPLNEQATIVVDLARADQVSDDTYDAFILTQTLGLIHDVRAALQHAFRILRPGGVLLCTVPAAGRLSQEDAGLDGDYWRFTEASVRRLFAEVFPIDAFEVTGFGNVLAGAAFLYGLADHELTVEELQVCDPYLPLVYGIRAVKPATALRAAPTSGDNDNQPHGTRETQSDAAHPLRRRSGHAPGNAKAVVLLYHRVVAAPSEMRPYSVTLDTFRGHMAVVRERYRVTSLGELAREAQTRTLSGPAVAVTFDDGYAETLRLAGECLAEHKIPVTVFVTGEGLDVPCEFWWDQLERVFAPDSTLPVELAIQAAGTPFRASTRSADERETAQRRIRELLYGAAPAARAAILTALVGWAGIEPSPRAPCRPIDSHELKRLAASPLITIGAHTLHHACLPLLDEGGRRFEIVENKKQLEGLVGRAVTAFAYPYGERDPATVRAVREAGFEVAVTVDERPVRNGTLPLLLPRCEPAESGQSEFARWLGQRFSRQ